MKTVQISRFGGPEGFEIVQVPTPTLRPGEVLVRVHAIGMNFADTLIRQDRYAVTPPLPLILGSEAAGVVEALGPGVEGVEIGQRVAAPLFAAPPGLGAYAEFVVIEAGFVAPMPDALSFEQAAAVMNQGLTALYLTRQAPPEGKVVLINAAAGGVGSLLMQLAKRAGARTLIGAASTEGKLDVARSLGADTVVNYTQADWVERVRAATDGAGPQIIYESAGGAVTTASLEVLAPQGEIVIYGALNIQSFQLGVSELVQLIFKNQSLTGFAFQPLLTPAGLKAGLAELFGLVVQGELRATIGARFPLEDASAAHRAMEARQTTGKLILKP
jgi:NADPH2:quinone reductase